VRELFWLMLVASAAGLVVWLWRWRQRWTAREQAAAARQASFLAQAKAAVVSPAAVASPAADAAALLFEAAQKAGEAGEPALAIQLYARLLARYPASALAGRARAHVDTLKKSVATARAPDTSVRG